MDLQKQDGDIRPILWGEIWRRCFEILTVNATPTSHCVKILVWFYDNLDTSDPNDPDVIIKIDISNVCNTTDRELTLDVLSGRFSRDYVCDLVKGQAIPHCETLSNLFGYSHVHTSR
jgi:hypothetical protein